MVKVMHDELIFNNLIYTPYILSSIHNPKDTLK